LAESPIQNDSDLLGNKELEKLDRNEAKQSIQDVTTDPSFQRTTKADPLTHLADTLENEMSKEGGKTAGDRMHQLERIINAVQTMLEDEDKVSDSPTTNYSHEQRKSAIRSLFDYPLSQLKSQILVLPTGTPDNQPPATITTTTHKPKHFTRPQTLAPFSTQKQRQFPFRDSNEQPDWNERDNDFDYQQPQNRPNNFHSTIRNRLFAPQNTPKWASEDPSPSSRRHQFNLDPEVHILKRLGSVYSSLFNMMSQQLGDYEDSSDGGLSLKRH
jgi:hypothetical protein